MSDGGIHTQRKANAPIVSASCAYSCETVAPILQYEDIGDLQNVVCALVKHGAVANSSCGIHVHADGVRQIPESLTRLLSFAVGRQDLFYEALGVGARADRRCHRISPTTGNGSFQTIRPSTPDSKA